MPTLDALRFYANYLVDTPGTGVCITGEPYPLAGDAANGTGLDPKTVKKILGKSVGKASEAAILQLCRVVAFGIPYVASHYQRLFDTPLPADIARQQRDLIRQVKHSQTAADIIVNIATALQQSLKHKDNLPFARNALFTGREKLLAQLHQNLLEQQLATLSSASLNGLGGVGKTQLALEYAYRYYDHYRHILWVSADGESILREDLAALGKLLMLPDAQLLDDKVRLVLDWLGENKDWLLIVDNAENLEHIKLVAQYFNFSSQGRMIITTRTQAPGRFATPFAVDLLTPAEGGLFLQKRTRRLNPDGTVSADAMAISARLEGLALALEQAGAYIEQRDISFQDYLQLYQQNSAALLKQDIGQDYSQSTYLTFAMSYDKIKTKNALAAQLLAEFSMCAPDGIPVFDIFTDIDELALYDAIAVLRDYSIIKWQPQSKILSIHRVVQDIIQDLLLT